MERHDLVHEFPEFKEKIHQLKTEDDHFRELFEQYHKVEHEVHRINNGEIAVIDEYAHEQKAKLLFMKDELVSILKNS